MLRLHQSRIAPSVLPLGEAYFEDITEQAGLDFALGHHGKSPLNIQETSGGGVAFVDYDQDGWQDILFVGPGKVKLYHNERNGQFRDVTEHSGLDLHDQFMGCAVGDVNNDGYPDLLLYGYGTLRLMLNQRNGTFREMTQQSGIRPAHPDDWFSGAAFADVDGRGCLDLYIARYVVFNTQTKPMCQRADVFGRFVSIACGPESYTAQHGIFYHNDGHGHFQDMTEARGLANCRGKTWAVLFTDVNGDGKPDLFLANDRMPQNLYLNEGGRFRDISMSSGVALEASGETPSGMGADAADLQGDSRMSLVVTNFANQPDCLFVNLGNSLFADQADGRGLGKATSPYLSWGCKFFDFNNDGWPDLVQTNGHVYDTIQQLSPNMTFRQTPQLLENRAGRFCDVSANGGASFRQPMVGRGMAVGDFDNDGQMDIAMVDLEGRARLLHNSGAFRYNHWLTLSLKGTRDNRCGYGAIVHLTAGGRRQTLEARTDGSVFSASDSRVHFGLGTASRADEIIIQWPTGLRQTLRAVPADRIITVTEGSAPRFIGNGPG